MKMNSIAALKRIPVGTIFILHAPWCSADGELREVFKVQTNAIVFKRDKTGKLSWLHFEKGDKVKAIDGGFMYICDGDEGNSLKYTLAY